MWKAAVTGTWVREEGVRDEGSGDEGLYGLEIVNTRDAGKKKDTCSKHTGRKNISVRDVNRR